MATGERGRCSRWKLPDSKRMLHPQTDRRDSQPAAQSHKDRLAAGTDQLHQISVQADGPHGHDDKKLGQLFEWLERGGGHAGGGCRSGNHRGQDKEKDKEGKDLFQGEAALLSSSGPFDFGGSPDGKGQCDGDNGQRAGELHNGSLIQGVGAGVHAVPGGRGGGNRGGVVHGRAGKQAEALVRQAQNSAQGGEDKGGENVKQEDYGDRLGNLLVAGADHWGCGGDGGAAADGGAHADQGRDVGGHVQ